MILDGCPGGILEQLHDHVLEMGGNVAQRGVLVVNHLDVGGPAVQPVAQYPHHPGSVDAHFRRLHALPNDPGIPRKSPPTVHKLLHHHTHTNAGGEELVQNSVGGQGVLGGVLQQLSLLLNCRENIGFGSGGIGHGPCYCGLAQHATQKRSESLIVGRALDFRLLRKRLSPICVAIAQLLDVLGIAQAVGEVRQLLHAVS
mmetsp:Transcript_60102/g.135562  ORF Transcript_60102/g.135562 Transcript_60102/m.135562 type:complete len:200 (+) Transcript_60102:66-665(+)